MMTDHFFGFKSYGRITQNAGTKITRLVEPSAAGFTTITYAEIITSTTEHILTALRPLGKTTVAEAITGSDTTWVMAASPGDYSNWCLADNTPAGSDWMALELDDGTLLLDTVSSLSTLTLTMSTGTGSAQTAAVGNQLWFFGVETDVNPYDGLAHARYTLAASGRTIIGEYPGDWITSFRQNEPILLVIDNGTAASTLDRVVAGYTTKASRKWTRATVTAGNTLTPAAY